MNGEPSPYPLLVLPTAQRVERAKQTGRGPGGVHRPGHGRQIQRLAPKFQLLQESFEAQRADFSSDLAGAEPEQVLVLETVGSITEFIRAVRRIDGLEFLGEFDEEDIPPDEDFYVESNTEKPLGGTVYLLLTNQQALQELLSLWQRFRQDPDATFAYGLARFRDLFKLLRDIRPWGPEDRLRDTGVIAEWQERIEAGYEELPVEIELWFRDDEEARTAAEREVRGRVVEAEGRVTATATIPDIRYHALLAVLPIEAVAPLFVDLTSIELVRSDRIMFLRPAGQAIPTHTAEVGLDSTLLPTTPEDLGDPLVAVLDGVPLEQHEMLAGRLVVDDPEDYTAEAPAGQRRHGTAIASLILHGDLGNPGPPLATRLYLRPVLKPGPDWVHQAPEQIPDDVLAVDLIHRAVRRVLDGEAGEPPIAPSVRIINLSIGDSAAPFTQMLSAWARLLDWVAWHYRVLPIVSAGNHRAQIVLPVPPEDVPTMSGEELELATLNVLADASSNRRLLPPGESVNALTVGASHYDESTLTATDHRFELIRSPWLPAPFSALGLGFRRSVKPDLLVPGGRQLYELDPEDGETSTFRLGQQPLDPPGQLVAAPVGPAGSLRGVVYQTGTSNAAALASRTAAQLHDVLVELSGDADSALPADQGILIATLKALLVHTGEFGDGLEILETALRGRVDQRRIREFASRFLGYGQINPGRALGSTQDRATLVGGGYIQAEDADIFTIPLPQGLSGKVGRRRLTVTLAWLTPCNPRDRRYRRARLWFDPPRAELQVARQEADWRAVQRGTVQHEILEGERAAVFADGDTLAIQVNCAPYAGMLDEPVPYGLALSLEAAPELGVQVFTEIRDQIRPMIAVRPTPA